MTIGAPKQITFILALVLAIIALLSGLGIFAIPALAAYTFWILFSAWLLLALGCLLPGL